MMLFFFSCCRFAFTHTSAARRRTTTSLWPNWTRRLTTNQKIGGSSPSRDIFLLGSRSNFWRCWCRCSFCAAWMPERSKGADLRSAGRKSAWVRTPLQACLPFLSTPALFCPRCKEAGPARFASRLSRFPRNYASVAPLPSLHGLMDKAHPS